MPKVLTLKQLLAKKYEYLEDLPKEILESLGRLVMGFVMIIWGESGNGKSNFVMQVLQRLVKYGNVLYVGLEEGHQATMQRIAAEHFSLEDSAKIKFANHTMNYAALMAVLKRKKSARIVVIDSVQYWNITVEDYKELKETFPKKIFIFLSHTKGKNPDGKTADKIKYDSDIKIFVQGYVAFIRSRFQGNKPYVIWEQGARKYWGKDYQKVTQGPGDVKENKKKSNKKQEEKEEAHNE